MKRNSKVGNVIPNFEKRRAEIDRQLLAQASKKQHSKMAEPMKPCSTK